MKHRFVANSEFDVIVVGAGVAGLGVARGFVLLGKKVLVLNKPERGVSSVHASGILDPLVDLDLRSEMLALTLPALKKYAGVIHQIESETGRKTGYEAIPLVYAALNIREEKKLKSLTSVLNRQNKIKATWMGALEIQKKEHGISGQVRGGLCLSSAARVVPPRLIKVLRIWLQQRGVIFKTVTQAGSLMVENGKTVGIRVGGRSFRAPRVVNCTGAWAGLFDPKTDFYQPIEPVRGQIVVYPRRKPLRILLHTVGGGYLIPWKNGRVLAGSTLERAGFCAQVTREGIKKIRQEAQKLLPELKKALPLKAWSGLRPRSRTGIPRIGKTCISGYYVADGYYRSGILISFYMGELLAAIAQTGKTPKVLKFFSLK